MTSEHKTIGLRADFCEAAFTETIRTKSTEVKVLLATSAGVDLLLQERGVEREEDDEGDADN